jgi:hypothetical protein
MQYSYIYWIGFTIVLIVSFVHDKNDQQIDKVALIFRPLSLALINPLVILVIVIAAFFYLSKHSICFFWNEITSLGNK